MQVAEARYTGRDRSHTRRLPDSGERPTFRRYPDNAEREWTPIESTEDAEYLESLSSFEVRWNTLGRIKAAGEDVLSAFNGYREKQEAVKELGLDVAANSEEEKLEEAIQDHVEELTEEGEL